MHRGKITLILALQNLLLQCSTSSDFNLTHLWIFHIRLNIMSFTFLALCRAEHSCTINIKHILWNVFSSIFVYNMAIKHMKKKMSLWESCTFSYNESYWWPQPSPSTCKVWSSNMFQVSFSGERSLKILIYVLKTHISEKTIEHNPKLFHNVEHHCKLIPKKQFNSHLHHQLKASLSLHKVTINSIWGLKFLSWQCNALVMFNEWSRLLWGGLRPLK